MDSFCFNNQNLDCLNMLLKYWFKGKTVVKSGKLVDNVQRAVHFNQKTEEWIECQASEETFEEKVQKKL